MSDPFVLAAVLLPLLVVLLIVLAIVKASPGNGPALAAWVAKLLRERWPLLLSSVIGFGLLPGVTALLWGLGAAFYLSGIFFVGSLSTLLVGAFGGRWVGPGAQEQEGADRESALLLIGPALIYTILFFVLSSIFSFGGFCPWPER